MPCDLEQILAIAERHRLPVIEDAACALGSEIQIGRTWERVGRPHGDAACFSFHPRKVISMGEGGLVTTRHAAWDERLRLLRQHGMSVPDTVRHASSSVIFEAYPLVGFNYRMTDLQAAIGREQLRRLPEIVRRRRWLAARYRTLLADIPELGLPVEPDWARSNWQSYCVRLPRRVRQLEVMQACWTRASAHGAASCAATWSRRTSAGSCGSLSRTRSRPTTGASYCPCSRP